MSQHVHASPPSMSSLSRRRSSLPVPGQKRGSDSALLPDLAEGAQSLAVDVQAHYAIEREARQLQLGDRGVALMRQSFAPLMVVCAAYAGLYWHWGMYSCLAFH